MRTRINNVNELRPERQYVAVIGTTDCPLVFAAGKWWVSDVELSWFDGLGVQIYDVKPEPDVLLEWVYPDGNQCRLLMNGDMELLTEDRGWGGMDIDYQFEPEWTLTREIVRLQARVAELEGK